VYVLALPLVEKLSVCVPCGAVRLYDWICFPVLLRVAVDRHVPATFGSGRAGALGRSTRRRDTTFRRATAWRAATTFGETADGQEDQREQQD